MECPTDIIIEIIQYLEIDELFKLCTLCQTSYKFLYKKLFSIKSITISIYKKANVIVIDDLMLNLPRLKILNKFINLHCVNLVINNNNKLSKLNRVIKCLPRGIKNLHLSTSINGFKWNRLFKFKELTHLYVDVDMLDKSTESVIIYTLRDTKLYYLYIHGYEDWSGADFLVVISKNVPDMKVMLEYIEEGHRKKEFVGKFINI